MPQVRQHGHLLQLLAFHEVCTTTRNELHQFEAYTRPDWANHASLGTQMAQLFATYHQQVLAVHWALDQT